MFEKFATDAREAVVRAQEAARTAGSDHIGAEHLLLGAVITPGSVAGRAVERLGLRTGDVVVLVRHLPTEVLDAEALAAVGVDLDAVRAQAEATFGPGALDGTRTPQRRTHLPFDAAAKKTLEVALREAVRFKQRRIDTGHLLFACARLDETRAHDVLDRLGVTPQALRQAVVAVWADGDETSSSHDSH
ncbi:Clp protease N-terminal domain-containing protein [Cellulomonas soli]|uniref:Clp protease n=1 Tax=Cellulomonas soli TaxID=931535 RepID=A0A512P921_9CELL|nr:Clp protease N-terminal domain-containing protein [Cellulomonas soli]NYI57848.1 ATP-dependent Clp protease ATP-binding subunit ClpA [Cellulomonas soli]GEP67632.1 Clp protease [Cellulomonas soli]